MAVDNLYRFAGMRFLGPQFGGTTTLGGVSTSAVNNNPEIIQDYADGGIHPTLTTIKAFAEELSFTTNNIDKAFDLIGSVGDCIDDGSSIEIYYARFTACSKGPAPGAIHRRITISQGDNVAGLFHPGSVSTDHRGDATFSFMVKPQTDGTNSPLTIEVDIALPADLQTRIDNQNRYTIGPVTLAGTIYNGIKSFGIEFGIGVTRESADSSIFDEFIGIEKTATKISLSGLNPDWVTPGTISGSALAHADTQLVLRRRTRGAAGYVPAATAEHIVITTNGLAVPTNVASSNEQNPVESGIDVYCDFDGINSPLTVQTGVAY